MATFWVAFSVSPTLAVEQKCIPRDEALRILQGNYGETPAALGVTESGKAIELLTAPSGSWTIIITDPSNNLACFLAAGPHWITIEQVKGRPL